MPGQPAAISFYHRIRQAANSQNLPVYSRFVEQANNARQGSYSKSKQVNVFQYSWHLA